MNLRQIEAFRATMLTGSVSRAADTIHVSQPSVSRLIGDLEASLGFDLFLRTANGVRPTEEARQLLEVVERSFVGIGKIRAAAEAIGDARSGRVALGVIPAFANAVMPRAVAKMREGAPDMRVAVGVRRSAVVVEEIETNRLDLGLVSPFPGMRDLETLFSHTFRYVCLLPAGHRFAATDAPVDLLALEDDSFVIFDEPHLEFMTDDRRVIAFMESRAKFSSHSAPVVAALAEATGAVAVIDPFTAASIECRGNAVCRNIVQELDYPVALVSRPDRSIAAKRLGAFLEEELMHWKAPQA